MSVIYKITGRSLLLPILSILTIITFSGCNDDVFIDRPKIEISSTSIGPGGSTTIQAWFDISSYPEMKIYLDNEDNTDDEYVIYDGSAKSYSDELLQLTVYVDATNRILTLTANRNYYPKDVLVKFSIHDKHDVSTTISVDTYASQDFTPGEISYNLTEWEYDTEPKLIEIEKGSIYNGENEPYYFPIIFKGLECSQQCKFVTDIPMINELLKNDFHEVPIVAFNRNDSPVVTDQTVIYGPLSGQDVFQIYEYPFVSNTTERVRVMPGQTLNYIINAEAEIRKVRYALPISNDYGVSLTITGYLEIAVPQKFSYSIIN